MLKRYLLTGAFAVALLGNSGCSSSNVTPAEGLLLSCQGFTTELNILAPLRANGTLSATAVKIVQAQKDAVDPICLGEAPDVDASVKDVTVKSGTSVLISVASQFIK